MIYNKHRPQNVPRDAVLVDRTTKWGNPSRMRLATRTDRRRTLREFCRYMLGHPDLILAAQRELRGRDLVCWCYPLDCHAEILQGVANSENPVAFLEQCVVKYMFDYRR